MRFGAAIEQQPERSSASLMLARFHERKSNVEKNMNDLVQRPFVGMSRKDRNHYSLSKIIRAGYSSKNLDGLELEMHQELQRGTTHKSEGTLVPNDVFYRDLNATNFGLGGAFVQTNIEPEVTELLRNRTVCERLGARRMIGLEGNVSLPRQTAAAQSLALAEQGQAQKSTPVVDQLLLTPHRVSAYCSYSKQLILQSSIDVESFLKDDIMAVQNIKTDFLTLQGQGGAEPTGVINTTGIGSMTFDGTASWPEIVAYEAALANANALGLPGARIGWAVSPSTKSRWKQIAKSGIGASTTVPIFLWDAGEDYGDGTNDGKVNGYRATDSNQILNNLVFFGNWADVVIGYFGQQMPLTLSWTHLQARPRRRSILR